MRPPDAGGLVAGSSDVPGAAVHTHTHLTPATPRAPPGRQPTPEPSTLQGCAVVVITLTTACRAPSPTVCEAFFFRAGARRRDVTSRGRLILAALYFLRGRAEPCLSPRSLSYTLLRAPQSHDIFGPCSMPQQDVSRCVPPVRGRPPRYRRNLAHGLRSAMACPSRCEEAFACDSDREKLATQPARAAPRRTSRGCALGVRHPRQSPSQITRIRKKTRCFFSKSAGETNEQRNPGPPHRTARHQPRQPAESRAQGRVGSSPGCAHLVQRDNPARARARLPFRLEDARYTP